MHGKDIIVNFIFPEGTKENYHYALLPSVPRIGDKIKSIVPGSGVYSVKGIAFVIDNFASTTNSPRANVEVELAALDEVSSI